MLATGPELPVQFVASEVRTVGELFRLRCRRSAARPAMYSKGSGGWNSVSWSEFYRRARSIAAGMQAHGLKSGDRVAILGPTQVPWALFDMAAQLLGLVSLGVYPKQSVEQVRYLLEHSESRMVLVSGEDELDTVLEASRLIESVHYIVPWQEELFEQHKHADERMTSPADLEKEPLSDGDVVSLQAQIDPDETAIFIYTSGTTGPPKGAMISHKNIVCLLAAQEDGLEVYQNDLSLNFLPMAHAAERVLGFYGRIDSGITTAYASSIGAVLSELQELRPTVFGSVPRIFEKAYAKIHSEVEKKSTRVQRVFAAAKSVALAAVPYKLRQEPLPLPLRLKYVVFDALVFRKVRAAFGGRVRWFLTGAAPIAMDILEFFWGAGLEIYEVYGMTEATVMTHANRPGQVRLGTVGRCIDPMRCKIADDGEVLMQGPFVFKGYYKNEEATSRAVVDGWLQTGDIGRIDDDGYLRITDRKKHLIITAGGKNLAPANIENAIKNQSPLITHVHAHGDRRAYVSALLSPSPIETLELGVELGLVAKEELELRTQELLANPAGRSAALNEATAKVVKHPAFVERVRQAVVAGNKLLAKVEKVRRFKVLERDFCQEEGELTPTMKLKRKAIEVQYEAVFDSIYNDAGFAEEP